MCGSLGGGSALTLKRTGGNLAENVVLASSVDLVLLVGAKSHEEDHFALLD